jgi:HlyD family secretion protein
MDKPRTGYAEKRRLQRTLMLVAAVVAVILITLGIKRIEPAAPTVQRETVWIDEVKQGPMMREVHGSGTLVPVEVQWISAPVDGRVVRIPNLPGVRVEADTVVLELSDEQVEQAALEAESQLRAAEAEYQNLRAQLESQLLAQQSQVAAVDSQSEQARLRADADSTLAKDGLIPDINYKVSKLHSDELGKQRQLEQERYRKSQLSNQAQLAAQRARVDQMRAMYELRRRQVESLRVRSGIPGVLQELPVQVGQRVSAGTILARVGRPEQLKAELRIPEVQAKDVQIGLPATIDTRNGVVPGHVIRVAPSVQEGTVTVDVGIDGPLPKGARPDLSIDGTIQIERLNNVLYVGRPASAQTDADIQLFKLTPDGSEAVRVPVKLGRNSVSTVEIVRGLQVGDKVILSDTSAYDGHDKIRLNG